ncbi:MAG: winged helix-turn-helix domain-containing protein [Sulfolobus sp.]
MELELSPPTRKVYYYLLKNRSGVTLRQIQEDLGFASTSAARYHIKKLVNAGLVEETFDGKYVVKKVVIDDDYLLLFNYILPKSVFFSSFFLTSFILILLFLYSHPFAMEIFGAITAFIAGILFLMDSVKKYYKLNKVTYRDEKNEED